MLLSSANVYIANCKRYTELVAIKALNLEALGSPLDDIMHEVQTMRAYRHDNILPLYTSFVKDQELWMVMPYMEVWGGYRDGQGAAVSYRANQTSCTLLQQTLVLNKDSSTLGLGIW